MCNQMIFVYLLSIFQFVYLLSIIVPGSLFLLLWGKQLQLLCQLKSCPWTMKHLMLLNCYFICWLRTRNPMNGKHKEVWVLHGVWKSVSRIMPGVNTLWNANTIVAMTKAGLRIRTVQSLALDRLFHFQMSHFFIIYKVKLLFATFNSRASWRWC